MDTATPITIDRELFWADRPVLDDVGRDLLFHKARTLNDFAPTPVDPALLEEAWDLAKNGPTAANSLPLRVLFVTTPEAKAKLGPTLAPGNYEKTMNAPVTAIFAYDLEFHHQLVKTFPQTNARAWFEGNDAMIDATAKLNAPLQAAYFMMALRAVGLDVGPMAGFDNAKVDAAFFAGTPWKSLFIANIGHGTTKNLFPRNPRLCFDEVAIVA